jgi:hypothetical protein
MSVGSLELQAFTREKIQDNYAVIEELEFVQQQRSTQSSVGSVDAPLSEDEAAVASSAETTSVSSTDESDLNEEDTDDI